MHLTAEGRGKEGEKKTASHCQGSQKALAQGGQR